MDEREVLIKLHRQYSKDETIQKLYKYLKQMEYEKGIMQSTIDELKYENEKMKESIRVKDDANMQLKRYSESLRKKFKETLLYTQLQNTIKKLREQNKKLKMTNDTLFCQINILRRNNS